MSLPEPLSAKFKDSFAYKTLSFRLPIIITKVIDLLCRERKQIPLMLNIAQEDIPKAVEETKELIEELAKLKYELQTNKSIQPIVSKLSDTQAWNDFLSYELKFNQNVVYFNVSWLYSECYFYRMMHEIFVRSKYFQKFDQFCMSKQESFKNCLKMASVIASKLINNTVPGKDLKDSFMVYTKISLWGNKLDLSISVGNTDNDDSKENISDYPAKILLNDIEALWEWVGKIKQKDSYRLDMVLDNAGYELFTDLCFVEALHILDLLPRTKGKVYFHIKKMPWFVSDTMLTDVNWLFEFIEKNPECSDELKKANNLFKENIHRELWILKEHDFWTLPHDYAQMPLVAPDLYEDLCNSSLIIFKGDLNYRKLVGDLKWDFNILFRHALRQFNPPPSVGICSLRTIKADVVVGLDNETIERIQTFPKGWMETGEYALISFTS